jgi:hypothetical protein
MVIMRFCRGNLQRNQMKHLFILVFFLGIITLPKSFATSQVPDILLYNGDTLAIYSNPLEQLYQKNSKRPNFFGSKIICSSTACWRGYQAEWQIIENQLYLTAIYNCCNDKIKADLKRLFGKKCVNGKVKATWVNESILSPQGKLIYYVHMGYGSLYEKEVELQFKKGELVGTKIYDNSKSRKSVYSQDLEKLAAHIYSNINWSALPSFENKIIKIYAQFSGNESGIIDTVEIVKSYSKIFDEEAIRVIKTIPDWDIFYRHGEFERSKFTVPIVFSNENRKKYEKK